MTPSIKPLFAAAVSPSQVRSEPPSQELTKLKEAARQFEGLLTKMMLKSMRDANKSFGDALFGSEQQDMYQDMFDSQLTTQLAGGRGLGLADLLVQQLARSSLTQPATSETPGSTSALDSPRAAAPSGLTPNPATPRAALSGSKQDFVRSMLPLARQAGAELGVDPHALVAQAALETGWGKSVPAAANGGSSFNLFGIKAGSQWSGASVKVPTLEFEEGVAVRKVERFRAYPTAADSFRDHASLIRNNPRYTQAVGSGDDVAAFAAALQQGGYATDPNYAQKMTAVAGEVRSLAGGEPLKSRSIAPLQRPESKS